MTYNNRLMIKVTKQEYWNELQNSENPLFTELVGKKISGNSNEWYWEYFGDNLSYEEAFREAMNLLEGKAFVMADTLDDSTNDCRTMLYLGCVDKNGNVRVHSYNDHTTFYTDDCDDFWELKDVLKEWNVPLAKGNPDIVKLLFSDEKEFEALVKKQSAADQKKAAIKIEVGETIQFGQYPHQKSESNDKQPIEWLVLDVQKKKVLLVSKYILDNKPYDEKNDWPIWEQSSIRKWLNEEFIDIAFSKEEQDRILLTKHGENSIRSMRWCGQTEEKIFLLSDKELEKYFDLSELEEVAHGTPYAIAKGLYCAPDFYKPEDYEDIEDGETAGYWSLRTGGSDVMLVVCPDGFDYEYAEDLRVDDLLGIRPALWMEI